jgi:hypothetical protein
LFLSCSVAVAGWCEEEERETRRRKKEKRESNSETGGLVIQSPPSSRHCQFDGSAGSRREVRADSERKERSLIYRSGGGEERIVLQGG